MGFIQFLGLVLVLALCALSGWMSDYQVLVRLAALTLLAFLVLLPALKSPGRSRLNPYVLGLVVVGFAFLSRVGALTEPSLGLAGFVALYASILGAYGVFFFALLRQTAREETIDEGFVRLDLWLFNLGLVSFAGLWLVAVMSEGFRLVVILKGFQQGLVPLGMLVLFILAVRYAATPARERLAATLVIAALAGCVALGAGRFWTVHRALESARRNLLEGKTAEAMQNAEEALAGNQILKWNGIQERVLVIQRDVRRARREYRSALQEMSDYLLRRPRDKMTDPAWEWFQEYLRSGPLEPSFRVFNRPEKIEILNLVHDRLARDPEENGTLQLLFVQSGYLDRLAEWYAWRGMPRIGDLDAWELALKRLADSRSGPTLEARYFLGVALYAAGRYDDAMTNFDKVLEARRYDPNAIVFTERIASAQGRLDLLTQTRKRPRRLTHAMMQGNHHWGLNLGAALWTALELNPGRYEVALKVRGKPAKDVWPQISVYLEQDDHRHDEGDLVLRETVRSTDWTTLRFEIKPEDESCRRMIIVFDNDYYSQTIGEKENRDLEFQEAEIRFSPR